MSLAAAREKLATASLFQVLVSEADGRLAGFFSLLRWPQATGAVDDIAVRPDLQGRGLGEAMMRWALAWFRQEGMRRAWLDVLWTTPPPSPFTGSWASPPAPPASPTAAHWARGRCGASWRASGAPTSSSGAGGSHAARPPHREAASLPLRRDQPQDRREEGAGGRCHLLRHRRPGHADAAARHRRPGRGRPRPGQPPLPGDGGPARVPARRRRAGTSGASASPSTRSGRC